MLRIAAAILCLLGIPIHGHAGTLTRNDECVWTFEGAIAKVDLAKFEAAIPATSCADRLRLVMDSPGGDVAAAMAIGRLLRKREAKISSCQCESSCVFIYLAGVTRWPDCGIRDRLKIGLHRVYWTELSASLSAEEVQSRRRELVERVRAYLDEMNASPLLLPMMEAVPPEKIRYLTEREIEELGITGEDPVYNERWVSRQAHVIGISSVEYRRRDAKADAKCEAFDDDCRHAIRWNVPVDQYRRAGEIARERCEKLKGEELVKCVQASVRSAATALAR